MELDEYYDIDSILAEHTRIPCIPQHDFKRETNLRGDDTEVTHGSRVELPYWIAKPLAQYTLPGNVPLISIELPKTYGTKVRNVLDIGATGVDFKLLCPYFYLFGIKLLDLVVDDSLAGILEKAFRSRLKEIMNYSQTTGSTAGQIFLQKLDETEKELFKAGQESASHFRRWRDRAIHQIKIADLGVWSKAQMELNPQNG